MAVSKQSGSLPHSPRTADGGVGGTGAIGAHEVLESFAISPDCMDHPKHYICTWTD